MKKQTMLKAIKTLTAGALLSASLFTQAQTIALDKVIAVVDDDVVMASELHQRMSMLATQLQANNTELPPPEVMQQQLLEHLIVESLQLQIGQRVGVTITDAELDQAIDRMKKANKLNHEQFIAKLKQDRLTLNSVREQIRRDMIIEQVQRGSVNRRIKISEQEIDNFLRSKEGELFSSPDYNLGHIFVGVASSASKDEITQAENKASYLHEQLQAGADFRQLAVANSNGQNALKGGDLGWRKSAQMPEIFADAIADISKGEITEPLRSGAGFHILKLYDKRGGGLQMIEQSKVRHILVKPSTILSDEEARQELVDIRQQIIDGEDFGEMAREHSEDVGSMLSGGDLGWSLPGKFVPAFEAAMDSTDVGDISEPFRSQFGWHILQVEERRQQDMSDTVKRNQARNLLRGRRFEEERINWLREIRDEAYVDIKG
ncbi:peptidylprolyl isomerase [Maricurvus nonylphenolicus]|uniref:peptidylprolyl isomerase n=1 Tax=Maricurvus nonylphenolicus TaxID=1008307 RepID=UPI0036F24E5E